MRQLTFTPPNDPPLDRAHLGAHAPSNRRGSRPDGGGLARGGGPRARALSPGGDADRRDRKKNRRGGRARGDPRDARPAHRPASPSAAQRGPRANPDASALDPRAPPRAASSPPPSLFAATRARQTRSSIASSPSSPARALARGLHLVGHLSIERWGAHVAVIPVREHPDDPAPTALVLAGSKGLRSRARAHALSSRGCVPDRWGHAHTILSPIVHPRALAFPLSGQPSLREELTRVSLLPWSVARAMGIDGFLPPDAREPEGFASRVALTSRLESGAFGGYVSLRVASNLDPERAFPLRFYASGGGAGGSVAGSSSRTIFDAAASPRTGRIVAGTDAGVASFRPWIDASRTGRPEIFCRCDSSVTAVAADVSYWSDAAGAGGGRGAAEVIAAGTRNGGISLVDTRDARRCVRDGGGRMTSLVCDLAAVRSHPGHVLAASADGGLARWDVRRASEPVTTYRAGSTSATFCATRRFAVDESETVVVMDGARTTPGTRGVPGSARDVECVTLWDLRWGKELWRYENVAREGRGETLPAAAVETSPAPRVWAGGRDTLRLFVPKQMCEGGWTSFATVGGWSELE